jgi:hypothetical protein
MLRREGSANSVIDTATHALRVPAYRINSSAVPRSPDRLAFPAAAAAAK